MRVIKLQLKETNARSSLLISFFRLIHVCFCFRLIGETREWRKWETLQRLAVDELGPAANLGGDALLARKLLAHALSEENGGLRERLVSYDSVR